METNKYYTLIEKLVKNHRKYELLGDRYSDAVQNVYDIAKPVLLSASDESSVEKYLVKLVSVTILKMSKELCVKKNHQVTENKVADYNDKIQNSLDIEENILDTQNNEIKNEELVSTIDISEQKENMLQAEEHFSSDLSVTLTEQIESDLKEESREIIDDLFSTNVTDNIYSNNINVSEESTYNYEVQNADANEEDTKFIQDDETTVQQDDYEQQNTNISVEDTNIVPVRDVEPNKELVDKMINGAIKEATNDLFESTADFFQEDDNSNDSELYINDENVIAEDQENVFEVSADNSADDYNLTEETVTEEIIGVDSQENSINTDLDIMNFNASESEETSNELVSEFNIEDSSDVQELSESETEQSVEFLSTDVEEFSIEDNSDTQELLESETEQSVEFLSTEVQEFNIDEDSSDIQMFTDTDNNIEINNLQISDDINVDDNLQNYDSDLDEKISFESDNNDGDLNLDISSDAGTDFVDIQNFNSDNADINLVEYTNEDIMSDINDEETLNYSLQEFDNDAQNSFDSYDASEDTNSENDNLIQSDNISGVDIMEQDVTVLEDTQDAPLLDNDTDIQIASEQSGYDSGENNSTTAVELDSETSEQIYNKIYELNSQFPELHICDIFKYRYAQKYSILEITTMLNIDEYTVADALNKIISVIEDL